MFQNNNIKFSKFSYIFIFIFLVCDIFFFFNIEVFVLFCIFNAFFFLINYIVKYFSKRIAYNIKNRFIIEKFKIVFVSAFFMFIVFSGYFKKVFKKINNFKIIYIKNIFYINYFKIINFFMYEVVRNVAVFVMNNFFFLFRNIDFSIINDTGRFANYIHMVSDNTSVKPLFFDTDYSIVFNNYKIYQDSFIQYFVTKVLKQLKMNFSVYEIIFFTIFVSVIIGIILYFLSYFFVYKDYNYEKVSIYECGFDPFSDIFIPFEVHYYLISILFIIFDIEISFIFPQSVNFFYIGFYGYVSVILFLVILTFGFIYEQFNKALEWKLILCG